MQEITLTRHNHLIDPAMHVWGWEIPVYLFLGGWVAGMMIIVGYFLFRDRHREQTCVCALLPGLSVILLSIGMLALFLDLEHKLYVWRLYTTFQVKSPMSWGAWILLLVYPSVGLVFLLRPPQLLRERVPLFDSIARRLEAPQLVRWIAAANVVLGLALGVYTGVLLSTLAARPFWNSAVLGPLFLVSGLSSAAAFTHLVARHPEERVTMAKSDNVFLAVELVLIALFLVGLATSAAPGMNAAGSVLGGPFTAVFWILVVGLGVVVPLIVQALAVSHVVRHTPVAPLLVLCGGLALRYVVVLAGQASRWTQ